MKRIVKSISVLLVIGLLLSINSCEKASEVLALPSMKATVDGVAWTSIFRYSTLYQSNNMIIITGTPEATEDVDKAIVLSIFGTETGTYNLSPGTLTTECEVVYKKTAGATDGSDNYYVAHTASITISKLDTDKRQISGTFSATLVPSSNLAGAEVNITSGTFENLNYQLND